MNILGITASQSGAAGGLPVSGAVLWLDASDSTTFTFSSGTRVSEWRDKSGNGYHFTQATSTYQPDRSATQNSKDAVKMRVGAQGYFMRNTAVNFFSSAFTVLTVIQPKTGNYTAYFGQDSTGYMQLGQDSANPSVLSISRIGQATASSNLTLANNTTGQITFKSTAGVSGGSLTVQIYKSKTAASSTQTLGSTASQAVSMIGGSISASAPLIADVYGDGGYLCELIIYQSALSDTNRELVEQYLINKWGV
jgi:hypothetical protein